MNAQRQEVLIRSTFTPVPSGSLQRKCACGNHTMASGECEERSKKKQTLQRASFSPRGKATEGEGEVPPIVHEVLRSPGQPLDPATRSFFEPRFGQDFSQVRVYTDTKAAESAREMNALAYTVGRDVVFGAGQHSSANTAGQTLLAHELAHVVQQRGKQFEAGLPLRVGSTRDIAERRADAFAETAAGGRQILADIQGEPCVNQTIQRANAQTTTPTDKGIATSLHSSSLCEVWQDPKDLSRVAAEHYLRTEHNIEPKFKEAICYGDITAGSCTVYFTPGNFLNDVVVDVYLAGSTIDVNRTDLRGPYCQYTYICKRKGPPIFTKVIYQDLPAPKTSNITTDQDGKRKHPVETDGLLARYDLDKQGKILGWKMDQIAKKVFEALHASKHAYVSVNGYYRALEGDVDFDPNQPIEVAKRALVQWIGTSKIPDIENRIFTYYGSGGPYPKNIGGEIEIKVAHSSQGPSAISPGSPLQPAPGKEPKKAIKEPEDESAIEAKYNIIPIEVSIPYEGGTKEYNQKLTLEITYQIPPIKQFSGRKIEISLGRFEVGFEGGGGSGGKIGEQSKKIWVADLGVSVNVTEVKVKEKLAGIVPPGMNLGLGLVFTANIAEDKPEIKGEFKIECHNYFLKVEGSHDSMQFSVGVQFDVADFFKRNK